MGSERAKRLHEHRQRFHERLQVGRAELSVAGHHPFLEILDWVEQAHDVAHRAVHLEALHVLGDAFHARLAPLRQFQPQVLGRVSDLLAALIGSHATERVGAPAAPGRAARASTPTPVRGSGGSAAQPSRSS